MMIERAIYRFQCGTPVTIRGYACPVNSPSVDNRCLVDGRHVPAVMMPTAFSAWLSRWRAGSSPMTVSVDHRDEPFYRIADHRSADIDFFVDPHGLGFELANIVCDGGAAGGWLDLVIRGQLSGASIQYSLAAGEPKRATHHGEPVGAIWNVVAIDHVTLTDSPAFRGARVWAADPDAAPATEIEMRWARGRAAYADFLRRSAENYQDYLRSQPAPASPKARRA